MQGLYVENILSHSTHIFWHLAHLEYQDDNDGADDDEDDDDDDEGN